MIVGLLSGYTLWIVFIYYISNFISIISPSIMFSSHLTGGRNLEKLDTVIEGAKIESILDPI
jgi:hypothetical protein